MEEIPHLAMRQSEDEDVCRIMYALKESGSLIVASSDHKDEVYEEVRRVIPQPVQIVSGTKKTVNNHSNYVSYLIDPYMHGGEDLSGVLFTRYLKNGRRNSLFMNYNDALDVIEVFVQTSGGISEVWDTLNGEIIEAEVVRKEENGYRIRLRLPCNHGVFVISEL